MADDHGRKSPDAERPPDATSSCAGDSTVPNRRSRSVTIDDQSTASVRETVVGAPDSVGGRSVSSSAAVAVDPLHQYRKALDYLERKQRLLDAELKRREEKEREEAPHRPYVSLYVVKSDRAPRDVEAVAQATHDWEKNRQAHLEKKRRQVQLEDDKAHAIVNHVDPQSSAICERKNYQPVYKTWKEVRLESEKKRQRLAEKMTPTFTPEIYSPMRRSRTRPRGAGGQPRVLPERSRSAVAARLHNEHILRNRRMERLSAELQEAQETEANARTAGAIGSGKRTVAQIEAHIKQLGEWQDKREAIHDLRRKLLDDDIELTFKPHVSAYSSTLAAMSREQRWNQLMDSSRAAGGQTRSPTSHAKKKGPPRNRRTENIAAANVVKCAPLPAAFLARNDRLLATKQARAAALKAEKLLEHERDCTFAPNINPVSDAIMRTVVAQQGIRAGSSQSAVDEPHFMRRTECAAHRATPSEEPVHFDRMLRADDHEPREAQRHHSETHHTYSHEPMSPAPMRPAATQRPLHQQHRPIDDDSFRSAVGSNPVPSAASSIAGPSSSSVERHDEIDSRMAELRATIELWNKLATDVKPAGRS